MVPMETAGIRCCRRLATARLQANLCALCLLLVLVLLAPVSSQGTQLPASRNGGAISRDGSSATLRTVSNTEVVEDLEIFTFEEETTAGYQDVQGVPIVDILPHGHQVRVSAYTWIRTSTYKGQGEHLMYSCHTWCPIKGDGT